MFKRQNSVGAPSHGTAGTMDNPALTVTAFLYLQLVILVFCSLSIDVAVITLSL